MNDYLHNLVGRTLQLSPLVRPRLPSLFEPFAAGPAVNPSPPFEAIPKDAPLTPSASEVFRGRVRPQGQQVRSEKSSRTTAPGTVDEDNGKNLEASRSAEPRPSEVTRSASHIVPPVAPQTIGPSIRALIAEAAQTRVPKSSSEASAREPAANLLSERPTFETRLIDLPGEERSRGRRDPVETTAMRALVSRAPRPATRDDRAERSVAQQQIDPFPEPETAPTINVTIGRVDVRAVFPQTQVPQARRAHPAPMSLDEYLKQRSEGRK